MFAPKLCIPCIIFLSNGSFCLGFVWLIYDHSIVGITARKVG